MGDYWLAMDIGCIECGEDSEVIGIYKTKEEAETACTQWIDSSEPWDREGRTGQHIEEVFKVTVPDA